MIIRVQVGDNGAQSEQIMSANETVFGTGSRGFRMNSKVTLNGKRYQINGTLTEIGSKPIA